MRTAVIASQDILDKHGVNELSSPLSSAAAASSGVTYKGWKISTSHSKIADETQTIHMQRHISSHCGVDPRNDDVIVINGDHLHLPPMLFPHDTLVLHHEPSHMTLSFTSTDAMMCWALKHTHPETLQVLEVPYAHKWTETLQSEGSDSDQRCMKQHKWDWTYMSDYNYSVKTPVGEFIVNDGEVINQSGLPSPPTTTETTEPTSTPSTSPLNWTPCPPGGINMDLLRAKDDIIFFDEILLYQDDLQDCGESQYDVKIRVMPTCWFVLSRLFVRVDGLQIIIRDTRLFHEFGSDKVVVEITHREGKESDYMSRSAERDTGATLQSMGSVPRPPPSASTGPHPHVTASQLRDANFMSRILPVRSVKNYSLSLNVV